MSDLFTYASRQTDPMKEMHCACYDEEARPLVNAPEATARPLRHDARERRRCHRHTCTHMAQLGTGEAPRQSNGREIASTGVPKFFFRNPPVTTYAILGLGYNPRPNTPLE